MTDGEHGQRRVCVQFAGGHPPMYYRADAIVAGNISAAFASVGDPVVTMDDRVQPELRPFPCRRLFQHPLAPPRG